MSDTDDDSASGLPRRERPRAGSGILGLLGAIVLVVAFHGMFVWGLWKVVHEQWVQSPAAIMITLAHVTIGSIGSVWLSRIVPRVLGTQYVHGWLTATTVSFLCTVATTAWLGYTTFELFPNIESLTGMKFGHIGLFLAIPASIYFWQLGRFFSW